MDKLFADEESTLENIDFDQILGPTKKGEWTEAVSLLFHTVSFLL